jgi:putative membrane protein
VELIANRPRPLPPKPEVGFRAGDLLLLRIVLDAVNPEDQIDRLLRDRRRGRRLVEIAPRAHAGQPSSAAKIRSSSRRRRENVRDSDEPYALRFESPTTRMAPRRRTSSARRGPLIHCAMATASQVMTALVALVHGYFLVLEMFLWVTPFGQKTFHRTEQEQEQTKVLAANQGLYNGFLAAGLVWSVVCPSYQVRLFFLACVVIAGTYGAISVSPRILLVQAVPAAAALALTLIAM